MKSSIVLLAVQTAVPYGPPRIPAGSLPADASVSSLAGVVTVASLAFRAEPMAANRCEFSGMIACSSSSFKRADKCFAQLGEEMKRTAEKGHMTPDRLAAGQTADGLVDHSLENRGRQIFLRGTFVDQRLDIRFCEYAAAGCDGVRATDNFSHTHSVRWHPSVKEKPSGR